MITMIALEKIIKDLELRIVIAKAQLARHNSGEEKLSLLGESSAENSLEEHGPLLIKYRDRMKEFEKIEKLDSYEHRRLRAAIERKKYYKYNKIKNTVKQKKQKFRDNDERIEAAMIIDELPEDIMLDNKEFYEITFKNMEQYLTFSDDAEKNLLSIQDEFNNLIKGFTDENIKSLELLNHMIPILIFHLHSFVKDIIDYKNSELEGEFTELDFFPKYHDWWISELWESHIAYFSLIKWKKSVKNSCLTDNQKKAWKIIFNNWIFVKTLVSEKSELAFEYQYILDNLVKKYAHLESELDTKIVNNMKIEMKEFIEQEDLLLLSSQHHVLTPYINYKVSNKKNL